MIFGYTPNYLKVGLAITPEQGADLSFRIAPATLVSVTDQGDYLLAEPA